MSIHRLIYASQSTDACTAASLRQILQAGVNNNHALGVTGMLCYNPGYFLQWLEGPRQAVNLLYHRISVDERHTNVELLYYHEVGSRAFPDWAMSYIRASDIQRSIIYRYMPDYTFNPYELTGPAAEAFMLDLSTLQIQSE